MARERERDAHNLEVQIEVYCMYVCIHSWNVEFAASKFLSRCNWHILDGRLVQKEDGTGVINLTLGDLLVFVTGADHPPPLGFLLSPEVEFTDDTSRTLPWASTCTVMLYLSVHLKEYDLFCNKMDNSMICSQGFGIV